MGILKCVRILLFLNVLHQSYAFSVPSLNLPIPSLPSQIARISSISPTLPNISSILPDVNFDFNAIIKRAEAFYSTLPETILEDARLLVPELIKKYGYPCEVHKVTTPDGYILTMHRIPHGKNGEAKDRPIVYLQHGLLSSSADWIVPGPEKALAYILADAGYDVWMANNRGTRYSRNHISLDPEGKEFWNFSWHDIALNDVTSMIDHALKTAKQNNLYYVGHSQGTTVFYVMCSEKPEYNNKIRAQISLAPIAYMSHMTSPLLQVFSLGEFGAETTFKIIGLYEFLPNTGFIGKVGKLLCGDDSVTQVLCTNSLFSVCGFNQNQMNVTLLPVMMGHTPAGSSTKQIQHYAQEINSGKFRQWDYGSSGNKKRYNNAEPPKYDLHKVKAPVYLFYSTNDWLSHEKDVLQLNNELGNVKQKYLIPDKKFNHVDYLYAINVRSLVYDHVLNVIKQH